MDYLNEERPVCANQQSVADDTNLSNRPLETKRKFDPDDMAEFLSPLFGLAAVAGVGWLCYVLCEMIYLIIADGAWEMKIADSSLTVGALFVVACLYFSFQMILCKSGKIFDAGKTFGTVFTAGVIELSSEIIERTGLFRSMISQSNPADTDETNEDNWDFDVNDQFKSYQTNQNHQNIEDKETVKSVDDQFNDVEEGKDSKISSLDFLSQSDEEKQTYNSSDRNKLLDSFKQKIEHEVVHLTCYGRFMRSEELLSIRDLLTALDGALMSVKTDKDLNALSN